jgi:hypothetical protein
MVLPRKHIPYSVRCAVAERQVRAIGVDPDQFDARPLSLRLDFLLTALFGGHGCHLDHHPALENREQIKDVDGVILRYVPDELDPAHLIYRDKHSHHIKTNVSGEHGQYADNVIAKRERRRKRKAAGKVKRKTKWPKGRKIKSRGFR